METNQKVGLSTIEWVLSIFGIIILLLLIILPPIFRVVFPETVLKEEQTKPQEETTTKQPSIVIDDSKYSKVVCVKQTTTAHYIDNTQIILAHQNGLLKILTDISVKTYMLDTKESESLYIDHKLSCSNISDDYSKVEGYQYLCHFSNDSVDVTQKYDLTKFQSATVDNLDGTTTQLQANYILDQRVDEIQNSLISGGYTCQ